MTLYYDSDRNAVVENHPEDWVYYDDDGCLVIDFDKAPREEKVTALLNAAASAVNGSEDYDLVTEPEYEWVGGD